MACYWPQCSHVRLCVCARVENLFVCAHYAPLTILSSGSVLPPHCFGDSTGWWGWRSRRLSSPLRAAASARGHAAGSDQTTTLSGKKNNPKPNTKTKQLTSKKKTKEKEPYETKRNFTSSALRAWMACLRTSPNGLFSAFSSANLFSSANTLPSIP